MNRIQAEHILDAYLLEKNNKNEQASDALKQVILDVMTNIQYYPIYNNAIKSSTDSSFKFI